MARQNRRDMSRDRGTVVSIVWLLWNEARCDESLAEELESKVSAFAGDFEFGMLDVASVASLSIETSPDSEYWFEGSATFTTFKTEGVEYKRAERKLNQIEDVRTQQFSNYFDFHQCTVSNLRIRELDFVNVQGIDRWMKAGGQVSPCVAVIPMDWPVNRVETTWLSSMMCPYPVR